MTSPAVSVDIDDLAQRLAERNARTYSLEYVVELTGISLRTLQRLCRADTVEHTPVGRYRRMTMRQIELLVASRRSGTTAAEPVEPDDMQQAIEMSRNSGGRRSPRRPR